MAQFNGREPVVPLQGHNLVLPMDGDLIVGQHPVRHGLGGPQLVPAHNQMHAGTVLGEGMGFFTGRVTTPNHGQGFVAELGCGPVAYGASTDAPAPELLFPGQVKAVGTGTCGQDHGVGALGLPLSLNGERSLAQVQLLGIGLQQTGSPAHGLGLHAVHEFRTQDALGKTGKVLHVGGGHQLTAGDAPLLKAGDEKGSQVGASGIEGCGVSRRPRADDNKVFGCGRGGHGTRQGKKEGKISFVS